MTMQEPSEHFKPANDIKRLINALLYSFAGLKTAFQNDIAFKQEVYLSVVIIPFALILGITTVEKIILLGSWMLVLIVEIINSSIESLVDRISLEINPLSKKIKDMASAAVFLSVVNVVAVWLFILIDNYVY